MGIRDLEPCQNKNRRAFNLCVLREIYSQFWQYWKQNASTVGERLRDPLHLWKNSLALFLQRKEPLD